MVQHALAWYIDINFNIAFGFVLEFCGYNFVGEFPLQFRDVAGIYVFLVAEEEIPGDKTAVQSAVGFAGSRRNVLNSVGVSGLRNGSGY